MSAAGGMDLSFLRSEKGVPDRSRRKNTRTPPTGATIRTSQLIMANPGSTGTVQKATEMVIREKSVVHLSRRRFLECGLRPQTLHTQCLQKPTGKTGIQ